MRARAAILFVLTVWIAAATHPQTAHAQTRDADLQSGIQAFQAQNFTAAQEAFSRLVQLDPSAKNYDYLAMAEVADGNVDRAIADFQRSIRLGNNSSSVHYNLGLAYVQHGQVESAIPEFREAVSIDPKYQPARYALGITLLKLGRPQEATEVIAKALKQASRDPRLWVALADAQFEAGETKQAVATSEDAMQAIPNNPRLAVTLASDCLHHQQIQTARNLLEDANELMPENTEVGMLLARASLRAGEPQEALAVLRGMPSSGKESPEKLHLMGEARALTGNLTAAEEDLASAVKESPGNARYLTTYAWVQQLQGQHNNAITTLSKARALDPKTPVIPYRMAVSYYFLGQYVRAEKYCREALQLRPHDAAAYLLLGITLLRQKNFGGAVASIQKAVSFNPGEALFHREFGEALFESGKAAAAKQQLDEALTLDPKDAESYFWRAKLLASGGSERKAIANLNTAVELNPNYSDAYGELARLYTKAGQIKQAARALAAEKHAQVSSKTSGTGLLHSLPENLQ